MKQNTGHKLSNRLPAAAILLLGLLASCGNLLVPKASPPAESAASGDSAGNTGSILVSITFPNTDTGTSARTAMPAADGLNWSVSASDGTQTVQAQGAYPDLTISLAHEGTWTFTARAVNDAGYEIFYGQAIQEITHGNAAVTIVPGPGQAMQTGTGSIRLVIQVAAGAGVADVYCKLVPIGNTAGGGSSSITPLTNGGSGWTFSEPAIGAGTYLLYLYFTDSAGATVYTTAESVNVWNGMTTDQWVNTGARYLTEHNGETVFLLTQDIIESFKQTVGTTVYVSETGFAGADGVGSVIAPAATMRQALAVLNGRDGTIIVDGNVAVTDEAIITNNQSVTVRGADAGGVLTNTGGRVFTVQAGASLTLGAGITLTGTNDRGNGGAVYVNGGTFTMEGGTISGNTASNGGGVYVDAGGAFEMSGGEISGNTASSDGGGVYVDSGTFTAGGAVRITENTGMSGGAASNVYLASGQTIAVGTGGFDPAASIGVGGDDTDGDGLIPVTDKAAANAQSIFTSDDTAYEIIAPGGTAMYLFSKTAAAAAGDVLYVGSDGSAAISSLTDAVNSANSSGGTITLLKDIDSTNDAFDTGSITFSGTNVTLDLNGNRIDRSAQANGNVITVSGGSSLTLADSAGGGMITGGNGVYVNTDGTFTMEGGTISGNTAGSGGGAVYVGADGTFEMSGGEISGNTAQYGGGGGAVYVNGGTFEMSGGEISGNTAQYGGGVYVASGTFEMSGGEISVNTAQYGGNGGAVYVNGGTFEMSGGEISGNAAVFSGGGVYVDSGTFEMSGGEISGNIAVSGGGVYVDSGTFTAGGAVRITGNTGMSGGAASNVYLASGQTIAVGTGGFDPAASIGVGGDDTDGDGLIPVTDKAAANAQSIFTSDDTAYEIIAPGGTAMYLFSKTAAAAAGDVLYVGSDGSAAISSLTDAVNSAKSSGGTITLLKDIDSTNDAFDTGSITFSGTNVTLDLNGNRIDRGLTSAQANGNVITVSGGSSLTLADSAGGGMLLTGGNGVSVNIDGTFTMEGGTISGNTAGFGGGAVYVGADGTFEMSGGEISGNTAQYGGGGAVYVNGGTFEMSGGEISGNTAQYGGGGVYVASGTFEMSGGEISGNAAVSSGGGGVYVASGTFEMSGGEISGNTDHSGGAVYVSGGTFEMSGGEISGNTAQYGGAVCVNGGTFEMSGGEISGNVAVFSGGGVYVDSGTFEMSGGEISGNTASSDGGGVYVDSGTLFDNGGTFDMNGGNITQDNTPQPVAPSNWYEQGLGSWTAGTVGGP